ncbi:MAG: glycosyltransferase [Hyphomonadaceae bacterium]|nr:glycosyltransferase [Hyphomonadaceae bacterium]
MPNAVPDVSVIMAAWRAADFIAPAIRSALAQDGVALELIIVDDASTDETLAAARAAGAGDPRLVLERLTQNGGPSVARNRALELAKGRYIAVLDSDDSFEPGRLARLVAFADETGADLVADNMTRVAQLGARAAAGSAFLDAAALSSAEQITLSAYLDPQTESRFGENLGYLKPLFRSETLRRTGLIYDTSLRNSEDFYLVASLLAEGARMWLHPTCGYNYLVRPGSISHRLTPELTAAILEAETAFTTRYGEAFDAVTRRAAAARMAQLRKSHAFESVISGLKARRPGVSLAALAHHPGAIGHIVGRLGAIAAQKLRREGGDQSNAETAQKASDQAATQ